MIYEDPTRRRWIISVASFTSLALFGIAVFGLLAAADMINPSFPQLQDGTGHAQTATHADNFIASTDLPSAAPTENLWQHTGSAHGTLASYATGSDAIPLSTLERSGGTLRTAFLLQQDSNSLKSFGTNAGKLDVVFPDWFTFSSPDCTVDTRIDPTATEAIRKSGVAIIARLSDGVGTMSYANQTSAILRDPALRACVADMVVGRAKANGAIGVLVDIESLTPADDGAYLSFLADIRSALHASGMRLVVAIPSGSQAYHVSMIADMADAVLVVMYGEHFPGSGPGPLASQQWFEDTLTHYAGAIPRDKLIVGIGSFGLDWQTSPTGTAAGLSFDDVMSIASHVGASPILSPIARNMTFAYKDDAGLTHDVWFLDSATAWNEWKRIQEAQVLGTAVWRLGSEDPTIWSFLGNADPSIKGITDASVLAGVSPMQDAEIYRIQATPQHGILSVVQDPQGMIVQAQYPKIPTGYALNRVGNVPPDKSLTLAFFDGPDPTWTPVIMDVLAADHVSATFFVVGDRAKQYPSVLQDIASAGYLIGNHGYRSGDLNILSPDQLWTDVNTTQRLIEDATKRTSRLFSASTPYTPEDASMLMSVSDFGYVLVSPRVQPDRATLTNVDALVGSVESQVKADPTAHVIALQNDGANQDVMVAALRRIIRDLQAQGYSFLPMEQAIGLNDSQLRPAYDGREAVFIGTTGFANGVRNLFWPVVGWIFVLTTGFSLLRLLFMIVFATRSVRNRRRIQYRSPGRKFVSVLIPAYNEQETIIKTLTSLKGNRHRKFEALVIDDGSTDLTGDLVREFAKSDPRFRLIQKPNGGKSTALNVGMREAKYDIVVTIDADTILFPNAISELVRPFADPKVDAVCGNVEVGNVHNLLTGFQALEYITAQNFDRRAFEELNAISVVPGATGAWRRERVLAIGGYESDTLTEDADMTIKMLINGGKIVYAPNAKSITEAPDTMRDLAKQRFRWSFGTFQCLGKYANQFFKGKVGWIALPNIFVFQIIFPLFAPLGDILFVVALIRGDYSLIFYSYLFFTLLDVAGSIFAFVLQRAPMKLLLFVLFQRFFYRQFLYVTIFRAILAILRGRRYGWNKLQRTGTVLALST